MHQCSEYFIYKYIIMSLFLILHVAITGDELEVKESCSLAHTEPSGQSEGVKWC